MKTTLMAFIIPALALLPLTATAVEPPTLVNVRLTGVFADWEFSLLPEDEGGANLGLLATLIGFEASVITPKRWVIEAGAEWLKALQAGGWAATVRGGRWFGLHGEPTKSQNTWFGGATTFAGLRFGRMPYESTADGYAPHSDVIALQVGAAYDLIRGGRSLGFDLRVFTAGSYRLMNRQPATDDLSWYYARTGPAKAGIEGGLSVGISIPP